MSGWFAVYRAVFDHPTFHRRPDRIAVWLWIISAAAYAETRQDAGGKTVIVQRGQLLTSYRQIEKATGVGVQVIRTLIERLENQHAIKTETNTGRMLISICNYDKYQPNGARGNTATNTAPNTELTQHQHTKEEGKNSVSKDTGEIAGLIDPIKALFDTTVALLESGGTPAKQARGMVGKWRKEHGDESLIAAVASAKRHGAVEPLQFIQGALKHTAARAAEPKTGDTKKTPRGDWVRYSEGIGWCPMSASEAAYYGLE